MNTSVTFLKAEFSLGSFPKKSFILFFLTVLFMSDMNAQINKCYTWEAEQEMRAQYPQLGTKADFENWMREKIVTSHVQNREIKTVPIVFHVIHDGDDVGSDDNISTEQIYAQIDQLNNDFGRVNGTSGWNTVSVGTATNIRFCAANGLVLDEPGIHRINRKSMGWEAPPYSVEYVEKTIKPESQLNPDSYLNVWVCRMDDGILGYAQFPIQSGLPGLAPTLGASTDGVVVIPNSIGSTDSPASSGWPFNKGRTATHEIGHFFGLRHIWGNGGCDVDDFCGDTPNSDNPNFGCPTSHVSCNTTDMVRNYMDYTNDDCMNIFTINQSQRMDAVLMNSPRRSFPDPVCIKCEEIANNTITVRNTTNWDNYSSVPSGGWHLGKIIVHSGATLTINVPISFEPSGAIYIYDGGKVILNSALTACDRWDGIRVFGGAEFVAYPGSLIENAVWGVSSTEWNEFLGTAKINCNGTFFRNNGVAAMIATKNAVEIERQPYEATFKNCKFWNNNDMRHEKFWAFITSYNIKGTADNPIGVRVTDCEFRDMQHDYLYPNKWNSGIVALNGDVGIWVSSFTNLHSGVEARTGVGENPRLIVAGCQFDNCSYGVINSGISSSGFSSNFFGFGSPYVGTETGQVGVVLQDNMTDTWFQNNHFSYNGGGSDPINFKWSEGLYINNIGASQTNVIRKNHYTNVDYANTARGNNANVDNGLHYLCNTNSNNSAFDFTAFSGYAIRDEQGLAKEDGFLPAGNTFSHLSWDFANFGPNKANYYHAKGNGSQTPGGNSGVANSGMGYYDGIILQPKKPTDHCDKESGRQELKTIQEAMDNEQDYSNYYGSHQVALHDYNNAKSSGNSDLIKSKKTSLTFKSDRLGQVVALGYDYARKQPNNRSETRMWMRRFNNVTGDYLLVGDYFATGEYDQGLAVLSEMAWKRRLTGKELIDLNKVTHIYQTIAEDGLANLNTSFLTDLETYAESKEGKSCFLARTILRNYGQYYAPIVDIPVQFGKIENVTDEETIKMSVSPNPADYHVIFDWSNFNTMGKEVRIEISNQMGMLIDVLRPEMGTTSQSWTTDKVSGSSCHYGLFIDGQETDSGQIIINK